MRDTLSPEAVFTQLFGGVLPFLLTVSLKKPLLSVQLYLLYKDALS